MGIEARVTRVLLARQGSEVAIRIGLTVAFRVAGDWWLPPLNAAPRTGPGSGCGNAITTVVTVLAGLLDYLGVDPEVACKTLLPSQWDVAASTP